MSLDKNIRFRCIACSKTSKGFVSDFVTVPGGIRLCEMLLECPTVPDQIYELRLHGIFPTYCEGRPCSSNVDGYIKIRDTVVLASETDYQNSIGDKLTYKDIQH